MTINWSSVLLFPKTHNWSTFTSLLTYVIPCLLFFAVQLFLNLRNFVADFLPQARLFIYMQSLTFPDNVLKVPKCEIFDRSDFHDLNIIKSLRKGDFGVQCVPWAFASVSSAYAQHKSKNYKFEKVPLKHAHHARKELIRALSVPQKLK